MGYYVKLNFVMDKKMELRNQSSKKTYLSIVVTTRNDDHGGNLHQRTQIFINGVLEQCRRYNFSAELIVVEWNPPADRPRLKEAYEWPVQNGPCRVRIIGVPPEIHNKLEHSDRLPLYQMIAKNVGIRRAKGEFVLATNIDILFSDELIQFFTKKQLQQRCMYRIDRYDVPSDVPPSAPVKEQLDYCKNNFFRIGGKCGTWNTKTGQYSVIYTKKHFEMFYTDPTPVRVPLFTNACGDFTILSKNDWLSVRAYPEWNMYSFHIDSILCFSAYHAGCKEIILEDPMRIYHIEHQAGWTPEGDKTLTNYLSSKGIPKISNEEFNDLAIQMRVRNQSFIANKEDWGYANIQFHEDVL